MDRIIQQTNDTLQTTDLNLVTASAWNQTSTVSNDNNSTLLYISDNRVEYKMESTTTVLPQSHRTPYNDFDQHVSPLDPNMSSVARYSPVYNEPTNQFNPVVIHQLVQPSTNETYDNNTTTVEVLPCINDNQTNTTDNMQVIENTFLEMVNNDRNDNASNNNANDRNHLELVPEDERGQVELLITDQTTGISYSVRSQEFLVEQCLENDQLLDSLSPDPLLESELLTLDDNTLKTELHDDLIGGAGDDADDPGIVVVGGNFVDTLLVDAKETKRDWQREMELEGQLLSKVYSIVDKPIQTRARATLPESYLYINKLMDDYGVFAKKSIPKSTQFGPMTGHLIENIDNTAQLNAMKYLLVENDKIKCLDVSDENVSNWMCLVRKAKNYDEQNLVLSQEGNGLYFTTTQTILPKQELKVGYGASYATLHNLPILTPEEMKCWSCFECDLNFITSNELQKHLNIHDEDVTTDKDAIKRKKCKRKRKAVPNKITNELWKCNDCNEVYVNPRKLNLRHHQIHKHKYDGVEPIEQRYTKIFNSKCDCNLYFNCESLLKLHNLIHDRDNSDEQTNHICPECMKKFPTQRQLIIHVSTHTMENLKIIHVETIRCPICRKLFPQKDRLRRHMPIHASDDNKPLKCDTCNKRFLNSSALAGHLKTHFSGHKIFECSICNMTFDHVLKLRLHVPEHSENNLYKCPHCSKIFKKYSMIRKHIRAFHCEQKHTCQHCAKTFPTIDKLRMHLLRHSDHREFLCSDCGKQFKRKDKLNEHCKRFHMGDRIENLRQKRRTKKLNEKKRVETKMEPNDFHLFIYKCHTCLVGFKRRGMLVNHLAKRHPDISPESVPELNLPILQTTRDYYCQHCDKVYKSSSKRKAHILKNHPGAPLPLSSHKSGDYNGLPNPSFSQTVGSITTRPQNCQWCHKQYASKAKLLQHQRKKHPDLINEKNKQEQIMLDEKRMGDEFELGQCLQDELKVKILKDTNVVYNNTMSTFQMTDDLLNSDFGTKNNNEYCHLVTISDGDLGASNSHLYRLLTTDGMEPPR